MASGQARSPSSGWAAVRSRVFARRPIGARRAAAVHASSRPARRKENTARHANSTPAAPDMFGGGSVRNSPALHRAARWGDLSRVEALLASQGDRSESSSSRIVDEADGNGSTALMWASQFGRDEVVRLLLSKGADATRRNRFGWSALEYASTSMLAGNVLPLLFAAPGVEPGRHVVVPPDLLGGAFARLLCTYDDADGLVEVPATGVRRATRLARGLLERYAQSAGQSTRDIREAADLDVVRPGGAAIAGCTFRPLGLYAGQRYHVRRLFWRRKRAPDSGGAEEWDEAAERAGRIVATSVDESPPATSDACRWEYELCAELHNPTWTPWGAIEVAVTAAELRSVRDELRWATSVAAGAAAFWIGSGVLLSGSVVSLASVPSESMAPGIHRGDTMLVDRRAAASAAAGVGDVVLFAPPPKLIAVARENGTPIGRGEYFVKRVVAVEGDVVEARRGVLFRNGVRETPYRTGTPVGVAEPVLFRRTGAAAGGGDEASDGLDAGGGDVEGIVDADRYGGGERAGAGSRELFSCGACRPGDYSFGPTRVPPGSVLVLGDNRGGSNDGHVWGYLPRENIRGRISVRLGPLDRAGRLRAEPLGELVRGQKVVQR